VHAAALPHGPCHRHAHTRDRPPPGTDADLRRLPHKRAGELLMTKFGMSAEVVNGLARWDRIDAIRR
jgi:hypothetical protein